MNPLIVMVGIGLATFAIINLFRVKATFVFMALAVGSLLTTFVGDGALDTIQMFIRSYSESSQATTQLVLLVLPALFTALFLRKTISGPKLITNTFPAALTALTAIYLVVPQLTSATSNRIMDSSYWATLVQYQTLIVGTAAFICLMQLWIGSQGARMKKSRHKK